jgi:hypothetical protein
MPFFKISYFSLCPTRQNSGYGFSQPVLKGPEAVQTFCFILSLNPDSDSKVKIYMKKDLRALVFTSYRFWIVEAVGRLNWNRVGKMILKDLQVSQGKRL